MRQCPVCRQRVEVMLRTSLGPRCPTCTRIERDVNVDMLRSLQFRRYVRKEG